MNISLFSQLAEHGPVAPEISIFGGRIDLFLAVELTIRQDENTALDECNSFLPCHEASQTMSQMNADLNKDHVNGMVIWSETLKIGNASDGG